MWRLADDYVNAIKVQPNIADAARQSRVAGLFDRLYSETFPTLAWILTSTSVLQAKPSARMRVQKSAAALMNVILNPEQDDETRDGETKDKATKDDQSRSRR